ncbi:caspase-3-like [Parambassis ranga]|uniref:Caspase-3-like n=1 Tax=Parambassis ranga TaxID=210632 RepID=A0A6P7JBE4_9TELE|nr:caspase-3-like [Parambassis ranga]
MLQSRTLKASQADWNRALLVSVGQFHPGVPLNQRPGVRRDTTTLHRTLSKLGFKVELHNDLNSEEIYELFLEESRRPVKECFLAVLSSHGEEDHVFGADGKPVQLSQIFAYFDNDYMEDKTKLFLVQACRGGDLDDGVEVDSAVNSFSQHRAVPVDTAVMYATPPGYAAFMNPAGSVFLQTFCNLLNDENSQNLELTRLLTRLSHRVAYTFQAKGGGLAGKKEMPCFMTRMTREVFPFVKTENEGGVSGISATSLVGPKKVRTRTPSIS